MKFSMYDVMLKEHNKWLGHSTGKLWRTIPKRHQAILKKRLGLHYVPPDYLEDNWHLNISTQHFANYRAAKDLQPYTEYGDGLVFGEKVFTAKWWVVTYLQFDLGYDYQGFVEKKDAYAYYKEKKEDHDYFEVIIFKIRQSNLTDFIPRDFTYPVQEIADKKYHNRRSKTKQSFIHWFCQYLHTLLFGQVKRCEEADVDWWWGLFCEFKDVEKEIKENKKNWLFHLYELYNLALDQMYDGGCTDINLYK